MRLPCVYMQISRCRPVSSSFVRAGIAATGDSEMLAPWTFKSGGQVVFTLPRAAALRSFILNHMIHHRGQLSVYLRLKNGSRYNLMDFIATVGRMLA